MLKRSAQSVSFHVFPFLSPPSYASIPPSIPPFIHLSPATSVATFSFLPTLLPCTPSSSMHVSILHDCPLPQIPPVVVVTTWGRVAVEHVPAPLVDEVAKGQEGNLLQGHLQQVVDVALCMKQSPNEVGKEPWQMALQSLGFCWHWGEESWMRSWNNISTYNCDP